MFRIAYITDTHIGAGKDAWSQQPAYYELLPELLAELRGYIQNNSVDLVLHGGDLTHEGSLNQIETATQLFADFPCPVYLVPGNHDLCGDAAISNWQEHGRKFFPEDATDSLDFAIDAGSARILCVTNAWADPYERNPFCWSLDAPQNAAITHKQYAWLEEQMAKDHSKAVILVMHETMYPLPVGLTGSLEPVHGPAGPYINSIKRFIKNHPQIKLVLSGHCHASCLTNTNSARHMTTAAFSEPPFQIRVIDIDEKRVDVSVAYPVDFMAYKLYYNEAKLWTAGKWKDWRIRIDL